MENIIKVSMFESAQSRYASGVVNLWDWLFLEDYRTVLIKELRNESDSMKRRELKELLPAITVSCVCSERRTEKNYEYTNLICIDIDGKDNPSISNIEDLKIKLGELPYIMYCGLSASGNGLFCIIPYADPTNHKNVFESIKNDFEEMGIIIDKSCGAIYAVYASFRMIRNRMSINMRKFICLSQNQKQWNIFISQNRDLKRNHLNPKRFLFPAL